MTFHKEGYPTLVVTVAFVLISNFLITKYLHEYNTVILASYTVYVLLLITVLQFFRSPNRKIKTESNNILSPADGKVVVIEEVIETEYFKDKRLQVSIFMSPKNVHVNWNPISGMVNFVKYHKGSHLVAWHPKASSDNERTSVVIKSEKVELMMRQIAGFLARRIKYYVKEGQEVKQGAQMGFIKFGSRVDLFLPVDTHLKVSIGDKVKGNRTVIAELD